MNILDTVSSNPLILIILRILFIVIINLQYGISFRISFEFFLQHPQAVAMQPLIEHGDKEITSKKKYCSHFLFLTSSWKNKKSVLVFIAELTVFCVGIVDKQK